MDFFLLCLCLCLCDDEEEEEEAEAEAEGEDAGWRDLDLIWIRPAMSASSSFWYLVFEEEDWLMGAASVEERRIEAPTATNRAKVVLLMAVACVCVVWWLVVAGC